MTAAPSVRVSGGASIAERRLFAPLEMQLEAGSWTCLLGGSGVGKSTLLRLIAGLPTAAQFQGSICASDHQDLHTRIAYMAQSDLLLPWGTVLDNMTLGMRLRGERSDMDRLSNIAERVGLSDHLDKKPAELSGGQRQRAALARTLMEDKPVILLDEPFSALDAQTRAAMQELATELLVNKTVLIVTHDPMEAARLGDRILLMTPERLIEFNPPNTPVPRALDELSTLECQADLLRLLRAELQ